MEKVKKEIQIIQKVSKATAARKEPIVKYYGTGGRKNAVARVWIKPGSGQIIVNKKLLDEYFARLAHKTNILKPFVATKTSGQFDLFCTVKGGGCSGQAGAISHGLARALSEASEDYRLVLRKGKFLTRDSRVVERKKYGRRKARKLTQFSKR